MAKEDERPLAPVYQIHRAQHCRHEPPYEVYDIARTVECMKCRAVLDPIECLVRIATTWQIYANRLRHYKPNN